MTNFWISFFFFFFLSFSFLLYILVNWDQYIEKQRSILAVHSFEFGKNFDLVIYFVVSGRENE